MGPLPEFVARTTPSFKHVNRAAYIVLLITVLATFFVVPFYTLAVPTEPTRTFTILDDLHSNIGFSETTPPPLAPVYYAYLAFVLLGLLAGIYNAFTEEEPKMFGANYALFVAAILAAWGADQKSIYVTKNTRDMTTATNGGFSFIGLSVPAIGLCPDAYALQIRY